jgi:hypothetical protein
MKQGNRNAGKPDGKRTFGSQTEGMILKWIYERNCEDVDLYFISGHKVKTLLRYIVHVMYTSCTILFLGIWLSCMSARNSNMYWKYCISLWQQFRTFSCTFDGRAVSCNIKATELTPCYDKLSSEVIWHLLIGRVLELWSSHKQSHSMYTFLWYAKDKACLFYSCTMWN